jgi:hypothetical protein
MPATLLLAMLHILGLSLLHSCGQLGAALLLYHTLLKTGSPLDAAGRHLLALLSLGTGLVLVAADFIPGTPWYLLNPGQQPLPALFLSPLSMAGITADRLRDLLTAGALIYLVIVSVRGIRLWLFSGQVLWLKRSAQPEIGRQWIDFTQAMAARLGIRSTTRVLLSVQVDTPQVIGIFKPAILIPVACLAGLTTCQLEAVLIHELAHIRRHDYALELLLANLDIIFFFNPFARKLIASIRTEREFCCDDTVLRYTAEPHSYAHALFSLEKNRRQAFTPGIAAAGNHPRQLLARIARITNTGYRAAAPWQQVVPSLLLLGFTVLLLAPAAPPAAIRRPLRIIHEVATAEKPGNVLIRTYRVPAAHVTRQHTLQQVINNITSRPALARRQPEPGADAINALTTTNEVPVFGGVPFENRQFSLPSPGFLEGQPAPLTGYDAAEPYVPATVLDYHLIPDTTIPVSRGSTLAENQAREALLKTKKALDELDWKAIEKALHNKSTDITRLKNEILRQVEGVDWLRVNREALLDKQAMMTDQLRQVLQRAQEIKKYELNEAWFESLQKQRAEQEALLKNQEIRRENMQRQNSEQQQLKQALKKKRIIYI